MNKRNLGASKLARDSVSWPRDAPIYSLTHFLHFMEKHEYVFEHSTRLRTLKNYANLNGDETVKTIGIHTGSDLEKNLFGIKNKTNKNILMY